MTQALYRKWRPRKWDQVVAQDHVVQTLRNAIKADRVGHAYLFSGPRGTGKTTTARLLAKAVNCLDENLGERPCDTCKNCQAVNEGRFLDLIEIDAASNTSVEDVRDLRDKINFSPSDGKYKVYIIDEVHMLSGAAFNALLKTLEEPPAHAIFILATTEVHKIPATVLSRCQRHEFRRIPVNEIVMTLKKLCEEEKINADEEALLLIARQSTGAMRDAISLLDQLSSTGNQVTLELAQQVLGTSTNQSVIELIDALQKNDSTAGMNAIHSTLDSGSDPRQYARQIVEFLRGMLLVKMGNEKQVEATTDTRTRMRQLGDLIDTNKLLDWIALFNESINDLRTSWQPALALEVAFSKSLSALHDPTQNMVVPKSNPVNKRIDEKPVSQNKSEEPQPKPSMEKNVPGKTESRTSTVEASEGRNGEITTAEVRSAWSQVRAGVKQRRSQTEALLNSHRLLQVKNGTLILGFSSETLKSKMENAENLELTREVINAVLQRDVPIQCVVVSNKGSTNVDDLDVDADGLVKAAIDLGAKLVHKE